MSERKNNLMMTKFGTAVAVPFVAVGAIAFVHGQNVENRGAKNRQIERDVISKQVDNLFPSYDQNAVDNSSQFISHIQHELSGLIAQGKIEEARNTLAENSEGIKQLGQVAENETIKNNIKTEIVNQKDLNELGRGSWYTGIGFLGFLVGGMSIVSGFLGDASTWLENRRNRKLFSTAEEPNQA